MTLSDGTLGLVLNINFEVRLKPLVLLNDPAATKENPTTIDLSGGSRTDDRPRRAARKFTLRGGRILSHQTMDRLFHPILDARSSGRNDQVNSCLGRWQPHPCVWYFPRMALPRVLLLIPPLTQLNTPYPSTPIDGIFAVTRL